MTKKSDTHSNTYSTSSNPNRYIVDSWLVLVGLRKDFLRNLCIEHVLRIEQFDFFYHCSLFTMLYLLSTRYVPFFWFVVYSATYCYATFTPEEANCKHCFLVLRPSTPLFLGNLWYSTWLKCSVLDKPEWSS